MGLKIRCHSDDRREEESRKRKVDVFEILRFALNDILCEGYIIQSFIFSPVFHFGILIRKSYP